jgi:hypothetical protein
MMSGWAVTIKRSGGGFDILDAKDGPIPPSDPDYGSDLHIVPIVEHNGEHIIGSHTLERDCYCQPRIRERTPARSFVIHQEAVN